MDFAHAARILDHRFAGRRIEWNMAMDWFIHQQNIERYRRLLSQPADEAQRRQLLKLLAEEEAKVRQAATRAAGAAA